MWRFCIIYLFLMYLKMQPKVSNNEDVQEKLRWLDGSVIPETIPTNVILKPKT